jgi:hypothetical protein
MGEPDAGNLHVRFDEEGGNPALTLLVKKKYCAVIHLCYGEEPLILHRPYA